MPQDIPRDTELAKARDRVDAFIRQVGDPSDEDPVSFDDVEPAWELIKRYLEEPQVISIAVPAIRPGTRVEFVNPVWMDPEKDPLTWACQQLEQHALQLDEAEEYGGRGLEAIPVAWRIVKVNLQGCREIVEVAQQALQLAAKAAGGEIDQVALLRARVNLAEMREKLDRAVPPPVVEEAEVIEATELW
jgi:hypothetical protein